MERTFIKKPTKKPLKFSRGSIIKPIPGSESLAPLKAHYIPEASQLNVSFVHESMPGWSAGPEMVHSKTIELAYVIYGKATGFINGKKILLKKGDYLIIPAGTPHRFEAGRAGLEAVSIFAPPINPDNPDAEIVFKRKAKV